MCFERVSIKESDFGMNQVELSSQKILAFIPGFNISIIFFWLYHVIFSDFENKYIVRTVLLLITVTLAAALLSTLRGSLFPEHSAAADVLLCIYWYVYFIVVGFILIRMQKKMGVK